MQCHISKILQRIVTGVCNLYINNVSFPKLENFLIGINKKGKIMILLEKKES